MLNLIPVGWRVGLAVGAVLLAVLSNLGVYAKGHSDGYHQADVEWQLKYAQREAQLEYQRSLEEARQQAANDAAKAEEAAELEAERKRQMASADRAMTLAAEAAADPNQANIAFDAEAVDRHNRRIE